MKIAFVTIHKANNYGAILQTYAMQQVLCRFGEAVLVDYDNKYLSLTLNPMRFSCSLHGILGMGKDFFRFLPRFRLVKKFNEFIIEQFIMTKSYSQTELLNNKLLGYDYYVVGSDQVWNSTCVSRESRLDPVYFLEFSPESAKKVSYASSMGGYLFNHHERSQVKKYLDTFAAVSVRESDTKQYLNELIGNHVENVLDPTLLLNKNQWQELIDTQIKSNNTPYILLYTVPKSSLVGAAVKYFSDKLNLRVVAIDQGLLAGARVNKHIRDAGPKDFLSLFLGAHFIITDSFHGVCFSINFECPFVALSPGKHANRVESLLSLVELSSRYATSESDFDGIPLEVDFYEANDCLEKAREESINFLRKAFSVAN